MDKCAGAFLKRISVGLFYIRHCFMKKLLFLFALLALALPVWAQKYVIRSCGQGYYYVAPYDLENLFSDAQDYSAYDSNCGLMRDGKIIPGFRDASAVDELGNVICVNYKKNTNSVRSLAGNEVIAPTNNSIEYVGDGLYLIGDYPDYSDSNSKEKESFYLFNPKTGWKSKPVSGYYYCQPFSEGMLAFVLDGKVGFIDKNGEVAIAPQYEYVCPFSEGLAAVCVGENWGFINKKGEIVITPVYEHNECWYDDGDEPDFCFRKGVVCMGNGDEYGVIDTKGRQIIPFGDSYCKYNAVTNEISMFDWTDDVVKFYNPQGQLLRSEKYSEPEGGINHGDRMIKFDCGYSSEEAQPYFEIYDLQGKLLFRGEAYISYGCLAG